MLLVVIDQFPSWALDRYLPQLSDKGILRRAASDGAYFEQVRYEFSSTYTAPGHTAIVTGAAPFKTGIGSNVWYDRATKRIFATISDPRYPTLGYSGEAKRSGSPLALKLDTVGDRLVKQSGGASQVVALSIKDRAAIMTGGKKAKLVVWYDTDAGGFTTSRFYADSFVPWLAAFREQYPPASLLQVWTPLDPGRLKRMAQPDGSPGEGDWLGFGTTFPHDPHKASKPLGVIKLAPQVGGQLWMLAERAAAELALGRDEHVDLLVVSASGCDYAGHTFGAESGEYVDHLMRTDLAIAHLFDKLSASYRVTLLVTGDHGVAPLPDGKAAGGRVTPDELRERAAIGARKAGIDEPLAAALPPSLYLSEAARGDEAAREAILEALASHRGVHRAFDSRRAAQLRASDDPLEQAVGRSMVEGMVGDVYVVQQRGWVMAQGRPAGHGTAHGSPWDYDRNVPLLLLGSGVPKLRRAEQVGQSRVAATLAAFLGLTSPPWSGEPLVVPTEAGAAAEVAP